MSEPNPIPSSSDRAGEQTEGPGEQSRAAPLVLQRKAAVLGLVAAAAAGALITATAMIVTGHSHSEAEISRLEKTIGKLTGEKQVAVEQLDKLRNSLDGQALAERRCEVIDGLEDCLRAGLKRPPRFAEADRQYLEERRAERPKTDGQASAANAGTGPGAGSAQERPTPRAAGKMSLDEFAQALGKIPGVAVDGSAVDRPERRTGLGKTTGKSGSE